MTYGKSIPQINILCYIREQDLVVQWGASSYVKVKVREGSHYESLHDTLHQWGDFEPQRKSIWPVFITSHYRAIIEGSEYVTM